MNHVPVTQSLRKPMRKPFSVGNFDPDSVGCCLVACTSNISSPGCESHQVVSFDLRHGTSGTLRKLPSPVDSSIASIYRGSLDKLVSSILLQWSACASCKGCVELLTRDPAEDPKCNMEYGSYDRPAKHLVSTKDTGL